MLAADAEPAFTAGNGAACNATFAWRWLAGKPVSKRLELVSCRKRAVEELLEECGFGSALTLRVDGEDVRRTVGEAGGFFSEGRATGLTGTDSHSDPENV